MSTSKEHLNTNRPLMRHKHTLWKLIGFIVVGFYLCHISWFYFNKWCPKILFLNKIQLKTWIFVLWPELQIYFCNAILCIVRRNHNLLTRCKFSRLTKIPVQMRSIATQKYAFPSCRMLRIVVRPPVIMHGSALPG